VRIRGEFLRYKDAREVAICINLSRPPPGRNVKEMWMQETVRIQRIKRRRRSDCFAADGQVGDLLRALWDPAESHAAACDRSQSVVAMRRTRAMLQRMIAQHSTYTAHKIRECCREHVKKYQMELHGWEVEYQFHQYAANFR